MVLDLEEEKRFEHAGDNPSKWRLLTAATSLPGVTDHQLCLALHAGNLKSPCLGSKHFSFPFPQSSLGFGFVFEKIETKKGGGYTLYSPSCWICEFKAGIKSQYQGVSHPLPPSSSLLMFGFLWINPEQ